MNLKSISNSHTMPDPLLSIPKIQRAMVCLTNRPTNPQANCMLNIPQARVSSLIGPNQTSHKFNIVRLLVVDMRFVSRSIVICSNFNFASMVKTVVKVLLGGRSLAHIVTLGSRRPVRALNLGSLCLGQGMMWKSCGTEYRKFRICGMSSSRSVFEKWARIATQANTIPAK